MTRKNNSAGNSFNQSLLNAAIEKVTNNISKGTYGIINSLIISRDNGIVLESYFNGYSRTSKHEFQSVTKSIQALLVGIALKEDFIKSIDEPIINYLSRYKNIDWSEGKDKITIRHLLEMTAGLSWNEGEVTYQSLENHSNMLAWSGNWIEFALGRPMLYKPGEVFQYSSANPIIISAILNEVTGMLHEEFAYKYLYKPLSITDFNYHRSINDNSILADVEMCPIDMAKIGLLVSNKGKWEGEQIVSSEWATEILEEHVHFKEDAVKYGFCWWIDSINCYSKQFKLYYAWGYGSQHIFIIPELSLVMVCTGKNYNVNKHQGPFELLRNEIVPIFV
ncbi:serine hydrolase domain-containing protein [Chondrinema litorale]|uniref:serine hydrolase domain-containing protein n=1 Tax=Chondrinema litorale TaxID=2994555 RepID=UPI0025438738|nr:serine hydrolase [Chondrinema litorale]UZR92764.1 serine hydrolase [Chondrinema litorale]